MEWLHDLHNPEGIKKLIEAFGLLLLFGIVFAETGLLVGFFLPGDSLLFVAGFVAATTPYLNIWTMIPMLCAAAIAGDSVGYFIGKRIGAPLFSRPDSRFFKRKHLDAAHEFYQKHGPKTIVLARFVPIVRTFAPTVAGAAGMDYKLFVLYNITGGIFWITSMSLLGYFLGNVPGVEENMSKFVLLIVFLSVLPMVVHAVKERRISQKAKREMQSNEARVGDAASH